MAEETYEYAVISLGNGLYQEDVMENLADVFDVGTNVCGCAGDAVARAFLASGIAREFERCNPAFVAGKSGIDLVEAMMPYLPGTSPGRWPERLGRTPDYWVGWALGFFQTFTGRTYESVFRAVPYDELRSMYWPFHEADERSFAVALAALVDGRREPTRLKRLREASGMTQAELARRSGVGLRSVQMYEQRNKDINKAQAISLLRLANALHCEPTDILER